VGVDVGDGLALGVGEADGVAAGCMLGLAVGLVDDDGVTMLVGAELQAAALKARAAKAARPLSRR